MYLTAAGESLVDYATRFLLLQDEALAVVEQVGIAKAVVREVWLKPSDHGHKFSNLGTSGFRARHFFDGFAETLVVATSKGLAVRRTHLKSLVNIENHRPI